MNGDGGDDGGDGAGCDDDCRVTNRRNDDGCENRRNCDDDAAHRQKNHRKTKLHPLHSLEF